MILLTPVGLFAAVLALIPSGDRDQDPDACRRHLFIRTFTAVPLAVFVGLSLFGSPKFHWTGPVWLMILPTMAWMIGQIGDHRNVVRRLRAVWRPTIIVTMCLYAFALHYAVLGVPGAPYPSFTKHYFWREATSEIEQVVQEVRESTGQEPIIIGMSRWSVASALSFYNRSENRMEIYSRNLFGDESSMYDLWAPAPGPTTRPVILVVMSYKHLERSRAGRDLDPMLDHPGPIQYREIIRDQKPIRRIYYRIAEGYLGD
jgi:dolichol-phosphate mannosyltransferase